MDVAPPDADRNVQPLITIVTDNGGPLRPFRFEAFIATRPELRHVRTRVRTPGQSGSRERGFGSLKYEKLFLEEIPDALDLVRHAEDYRRDYNTVRPHETLAWNRPNDVHIDDAAPSSPTFRNRKTCQLLDVGHEEANTKTERSQFNRERGWLEPSSRVELGGSADGGADTQTAIDIEDHASDVGGGRRTEEGRRLSDVSRRAGVPKRDLGDELVARGAVHRGQHRRLDQAGRNGVGGDAVASSLESDSAGESDDSGLGRGVVRLSEVSSPAHRGKGQDPAVASLLHGRKHGTETEEAGREVGVQHSVPVSVVHVGRAVVADDPGIVDQDIDSAPVGEDLPDPVVHFSGAAHVELSSLGYDPMFVSQFRSELCACGSVDLADCYRGAFSRKAVSHRISQPPSCPRDDDSLSDIAIHAVPFV